MYDTIESLARALAEREESHRVDAELGPMVPLLTVIPRPVPVAQHVTELTVSAWQPRR